MKKLSFIFLLSFAALIAQAQTSDRFQFLLNGKAVFDSVFVRAVHIDTVFVPRDTIIPIPVSDFYSCLYIDKLSSRLGNAAEEEKLIAYSIQNGFNAWAEYTLQSIIGVASAEAQLRSLHVRARARGIKFIEGTTSGSASSISDRIAFNMRCTKAEERFTDINTEFEAWNAADKNAAAAIDSIQLKDQRAKTAAAGIESNQYWGWLKFAPFIQTKFISMLIANTDNLPHHYYQTIPNISYHLQETDSLNAVAKRMKVAYKYRPIFSSELAFSQNILKTKTPKQLFLDWKVGFDSKKYTNLICDGFYMFDFSYLEVAIPYRSAAATTIRRSAMISDSFINGTTESHILTATEK